MIESNKKSLAGEFYVMHRFFLKGYEATLTLGNTKGIDILVYNSKNNKQFKVEVKTTEMITNGKVFGKNMDWFMGKKHEDMEDDSLIYCFVFNDTATTEIYTLSLHDALPILARTYFQTI